MEKRQHVLPLLSLNGRELWIQALLPLQMGQNQRTEELAQFLHQIGTRRNGHTTLVMPLKLSSKDDLPSRPASAPVSIPCGIDPPNGHTEPQRRQGKRHDLFF